MDRPVSVVPCAQTKTCALTKTRALSLETQTDRTLLSRRGLLTVLAVTPAVGTVAALSSPSNMSSGEAGEAKYLQPHRSRADLLRGGPILI